MYFWSALIAFGAVAFSVQSSSLLVVLAIVVLSAVGLVVLLLPRFRPRVPIWAQSLVPPRYRRRSLPAEATRAPVAEATAPAAGSGTTRAAVTAAAGRPVGTVAGAVSGGSALPDPAARDNGAGEPALAALNGSTAVGERHRFAPHRKTGSRELRQ